MGRTLDPAMPTSSSDDELASRFSGFFSEIIIHIRSEIDASVDVLRYIRETRKTCILDPINVSKLGETYESAAPAVGAIINSSLDEDHFVATETWLNSALP